MAEVNLKEIEEKLDEVGRTVVSVNDYVEQTAVKVEKLEETVRKVEALAKRANEISRRQTLSGIINRYGPTDGKDLLTRALTDPTPHARFLKGEALNNDDTLVLRFQEANDRLLLAAMALGLEPKPEVFARRLPKLWHDFQTLASDLARAMDTGTELADWLMTQMSPRLLNLVRLELKVAALFEEVNMPRSPYEFPIEGADFSVQYALASEVTDASSMSKWTHVGTTGSKVTLTAKKSVARTVFSDEADEESIVPLLPFLERKHALHHAICIEQAILNGDTTATHMDSDVTASTDFRKAWDGLRDIALNTKSSATVNLGTFSTANLRTLRKAMGKYGVNPDRCAWITSIAGLFSFLGLDEVITVDKYGPNATVLKGELAKFDGIPLIVSEYCRQDLNASGVYDGTTTTKTVVYLVNRDSFLVGNRKGVTTKFSDQVLMEYGAQVIVSYKRTAFADVFSGSSDLDVVLGINVG